MNRFAVTVKVKQMNEAKTGQSDQASTCQSYVLSIRLSRAEQIRIGQLGTFSFSQGYYLYVGSARRGLDARISRHLADEKTRHWHIDYLLEHTRIETVYVSEYPECNLADTVRNRTDAAEPINGFGASDCSCTTHLLYRSERPDLALPVHTERSG